MFGEVIYKGIDGYAEYLLADEKGVQVYACLTGQHIHLFRIEWPDEKDPTYRYNKAEYSLADAIAAFNEHATKAVQANRKPAKKRERLVENPLYSLLVSNVGWVMQDEPSLEKAEGLFEYYNDGTYEQVTMWSSLEPEPIKEDYHDGGL